MKNHKRALLAAVSVLALSGTATAADFEAPPVYSSWTGFYGAIGVGGRYGFSGTSIDMIDDENGDVISSRNFNNIGDAGVFGTAELGYDWQLDDSSLLIGVVGNFDFGEALSAAVSETTMGATREIASWKVDNSWGIGARAGFLATPSTLFYGVAGFTQADITSTVASKASMGAQAPLFSNNEWETGYFVGAGIETQFTDQVAGKLEYRYANYGGVTAVSDTFSSMSNTVANVGKSDLEIHAVRATLVWRFGNLSGVPEAAATLPAPSVDASWNGFYAAAGAGGRFVFTDAEVSTVYVNSKSSSMAAGGLSDFGSPDGFGTVEVGYDTQLEGSGFVLGAVANFDFAGGVTAEVTKTSMMGTGATTFIADWTVGNSWGIGVRAGVQAMDSALVYGVAGFTQAEVDRSVATKASMGGMGASPSPAVVTSDSGWQSGFFVGGGIETALTEQIGAKLEYRYSNYDGATATSEQFQSMNATAVNVASSGDIDVHSVRGTLVWRFGGLDY